MTMIIAPSLNCVVMNLSADNTVFDITIILASVQFGVIFREKRYGKNGKFSQTYHLFLNLTFDEIDKRFYVIISVIQKRNGLLHFDIKTRCLHHSACCRETS